MSRISQPGAGLAEGAPYREKQRALRSRPLAVGWHNPLQTYFVQVIDRTWESAGDDKRRMLLWAGRRSNELCDVDQLARKLVRFAHLTPEMRSTLCGDKDTGR
jgi:hypothetical protein